MIGADHIMWGSDYPHLEGTFPFSLEALQRTFSDVEPTEAQAMLGGTAAALYGFDMAALATVAAACGPRVSDVTKGLDAVPQGSRSLAFRERPPLNV